MDFVEGFAHLATGQASASGSRHARRGRLVDISVFHEAVYANLGTIRGQWTDASELARRIARRTYWVGDISGILPLEAIALLLANVVAVLPKHISVISFSVLRGVVETLSTLREITAITIDAVCVERLAWSLWQRV